MIEYSVVVPCRNGGARLARQLKALMSQEFEGTYEVIVADNGSSDDSVAIVAWFGSQYSTIRGVDASDRVGINHARNVGVGVSLGKFVLLCDADDEVTPLWISAVDKVRHEGARCIGGAVDRRLSTGQSLGVDGGVYYAYWGLPWPIGANCGFERQVFDEIGGFDESFVGGGDETDFFWRANLAGYPTLPAPDAVVVYYVRDRLRDVARQHFRYGRATVKLYMKFRALGMPRSPIWRLPLALGWGVGRLALSPPNSLARRRAVGDLAGRAGRVFESLKSGVLYL